MQIQQALINHCEELRYRFAVLDGPAPSADSMADVQALRQRYDTKYAAVYHPWLLIPDAMPDNLASIQQVAIPPAGHVLGIYARTDIERGANGALREYRLTAFAPLCTSSIAASARCACTSTCSAAPI